MKNKVFLVSVLGLDFDLPLLPHFLEHYLKLGIKPENYENNLRKAQKVLEKYDIQSSDLWLEEYESVEKWSRVDRLLSENTSADDWIIHPDFDEFHQYPDSLEKVLFDFEKRGINAAQGVLVDRVAPGGIIAKVKDGINIFDQFPIKTNFAKLLYISGVKLMIYRANMRANNGSGQIHNKCKKVVNYPYGRNSLDKFNFVKNLVGDFDDLNRVFVEGEYESNIDSWKKLEDDFGFLVHHFKWTGQVIEKLEQRVETYKRLNRAQWFQSQNFLDYFRKNNKILV